jgi:hypothetical protein
MAPIQEPQPNVLQLIDHHLLAQCVELELTTAPAPSQRLLDHGHNLACIGLQDHLGRA